jgi:hypothetical protein
MNIEFQTIIDEAARHAASSLDSAVLRILDKALGAGKWTLNGYILHGELREHGNSVEVFWDDRKLATIHRHQRWEETVSAPSCRWTMTLSVCQHVEHVKAG